MIFSDLDSTEGYYICFDIIGKYSPSVYTVVRISLFGVPSVVLVNTDKGGDLRGHEHTW